MYSNKINIEILTALLRQHEVTDAVVCPGSRNAAIVNNLVECPEIKCHMATDERSAAFEAMGIALSSGRITVVCVTSGSALLNTLPAVAEAWYQHVPLMVISADRPAAWIEQLDGQTINQPGALERWCCMSVDLPEANSATEAWRCNWMVNKAIIKAYHHSQPVHINVQIEEPLYKFSNQDLPVERKVVMRSVEDLYDSFREHKRVMIVAGQRHRYSILDFDVLKKYAVVVTEPLTWCNYHTDGETLIEEMDEPDMVIYLGGTIVSKRVKSFLRDAIDAEYWYISEDGEIADTFMHVRNVLFCNNIEQLLWELERRTEEKDLSYVKQWNSLQMRKKRANAPEEEFVARLEDVVDGESFNLCYANSMAVRYACRHARHNIFCNRGVNGIEGSVSTALGIAIGDRNRLCVCVTGDLSFFYDSNALWRNELPSNLRIAVLNNGGGKIFERFDGLKGNEAKPYITGEHQMSCRELCKGYGVEYRKCTIKNMKEDIAWLIEGENAKVLEFITK